MKKLISIFLFLFMIIPISRAQVQVPQASPHASLEQMVGLSEVEIEYSRPSMRDRKIFGELVPYNQLWRTGANENTKITFSDDVMIAGKLLKKGTYAIFTNPGKESWKIYFYNDTTNWGLPQKWDDGKIALEAKAKVNILPNRTESFTIMIDNLTNSSATLNFSWENTTASLEFEVSTQEKAMESIKTTLKGEPKWSDYYAAADYYFSEKKDLKQALTWITKSVEMKKDAPYYVTRKKALIEYELGMRDAAVKTAKKSLEAAKKANNEDYVKMNEASLKEWGAM